MLRNTIVVLESANRKLGKFECDAIYRNIDSTCSSECLLYRNGCYALRTPTFYSQSRAMNRNDSLDIIDGSRPVRINVSGDILLNQKVDYPFIEQIKNLGNKYPNQYIWGYTHFWNKVDPDIFGNVVMLASCDSLDARLEAKEKGWKRTARVINSPEEKTSSEVFCPYDYAKHKDIRIDNIKTNCFDCKLCFSSKELDIAFIKS